MKFKYFVTFLAIYFLGFIINYSYFKKQISDQKNRIENLKNSLATNQVKFDSLKFVINDLKKVDSLLDIEIEKTKNKTYVNQNNSNSTFNKIKVRPSKSLNNSHIRNEQNKVTENTDSIKKALFEKDIAEKNTINKYEDHKKIKHIYPYSNRNRQVSLRDSFIKVEYNPNNDDITNSMIDHPTRVKINDIYVVLISSGEYYNDDDEAFYVLMIKSPKKNLKLGKNKVTIIDNVNREHVHYFNVTR